MRKKEKEKKKEVFQASVLTKKPYEPPVVSVLVIEMEQGIAAGSSHIIPNTDVGQVTTDWESEDTTTINTPY